MFDKAVGYSKAGDVDVRGVLRDVGGDGIVQAACDSAVLDCDDSGHLGANVLHYLFVQGLEEAHVVVQDRYALCGCFVGCFCN